MIMYMYKELPTLPDSAKSSQKINQSFHVLMNRFENLPDYRSYVPIRLNVILNTSLIFVQVLPDCKMQMLAALIYIVTVSNK